VDKKEKKKPLCILGTAPSVARAPFDSEIDGEHLYEIWAISTAEKLPQVKRVDRLFEMHPKRYYGIPTVTEQLNDFDGPVYMQEHVDEIPKSVKYPHDEVKEKFFHPVMGENLYVTNTITWMILLALHEGYTDISLYGVHMAHETEYAYQRSSCSWAVGIIHGWIIAGMPYKLYIAEESSILKAEYEYGFDEPTAAMQFLKGRMDGMRLGVKEAQGKINELHDRQMRTEGAIGEAQLLYNKLAGLR
jgi:hypothetical protein